MLEKAFYMYALITVFLAAIACRPGHSQSVDLKDLKLTETTQSLKKAEEGREERRLAEEQRQKEIQEQKDRNEEEFQKRIQDSHDLVPTGKEKGPKSFNPATGKWE